MARTADDVRPLKTDRVPPHNLEAEESVLGSMMLEAEAIAEVLEILKPDDFYRSAHRKIYQAMLDLFAAGEPVDAITTVEELRRGNALEEIGGALYIHHLVENVPAAASAGHYARIVAELALLRRLIRAAGDIIQKAYDVPDEPERLADEAEGLIYGVARHSEKDEVVGLSELVSESMESLERLHDRESAYAGVPTGFRDLDGLLQGLHPSNLIVIAARPGVGKSSFVTNVARNVAVESGQTVALFSLEMSRQEIAMRLLCAEARVPWDKVRAARVAAEDWARITEAAEILDRAPIWIADSGSMTIVDIRAKARRMKSKSGLGLIIVDYLQLMSSHHRVENRQQEIAEISRSLKMLAKELEVPVIAVSQLNRDPERRQDKRPQLADLRECVTGDTLVTLSDGRRVPIRDLEGTTPEVLGIAPDHRLVAAHSDKVWRVGRRPVFEVRLASGRAIRCTEDHRLLGPKGWVRVRDLEAGDRLGIARWLPEPSDPVEWPDDRVALLGQLIGDGSYLDRQPLRYTSASEENLSLVSSAAEREFNARVSHIAGRGSWRQLFIGGNGNRWHPAGVRDWLRQLGILGQRSHEKHLPDEVFSLSNRQVALLLRHLWATDGSIFTRPAGQKGSSRIFYATNSRRLAADVAALLLRFSIVARIRTARKPGARSWYTVDVSGSTRQRGFLDSVGAFGSRKEQAAKLSQRLAGMSPGTNVDTLPRDVFDRVKRVMAERGLSHRSMARFRGTAYGGSAHFAFAPSRSTVAQYAEILDDDVLRLHAESDVFWDNVRSVEPIGEEDVFDLTVPGPASWLADSVISHNSGAIEQDSDVVMFIHREDVFNDDPAVKGLAEVIVAKHRNGPTAKVQLTFLAQLTQFRNHAREQ